MIYKNVCLLLISLFALSCIDNKEKDIVLKEETVRATTEEGATRRDSVIAFAKRYIGTPYCYAGNSPEKGFDCSGFVNFVFANFDIELPRSSSQFEDLGTPLDPKDFKKGDILVFYGYQDSSSIGHLGIVSEANGMDSKFIHASSGSEYAVTISELNSDHYTRRFYKCIDVINP